MKRKSKTRFSQIMIHKTIKHELDGLKETVRIHTRVNHRISYADVIIFLIKHYNKSLRVEYPIEQKLLVGKKLENKNLNVSIPITPKPYSAKAKLDGKLKARFC